MHILRGDSGTPASRVENSAQVLSRQLKFRCVSGLFLSKVTFISQTQLIDKTSDDI